MKQRSKQAVKTFLLAAILALSASAQPRTITGKVVGIVDGDTLDILARKRTIRIRLQGVDSPESSQDFGQRSKQSLSDLVFGKTVTVVSAKRDRYKRPLGKVTLDGKDINLEQINRGMAWYYRAYAHKLRRDDAVAYERAESDAKTGKRGLWADTSPTPPWNFRRGVGTAKAPSRNPKTPTTVAVPIIGNRNSKIYHLSNCPSYNKVSERNRVPFKSEQEAQAAGFRKAKNCP